MTIPRTLITLLLALGALQLGARKQPAPAAAYDIVPMPSTLNHVDNGTRQFTLRDGVAIRAADSLAFEADRLRQLVRQVSGIELRTDPKARLEGSITLCIDPLIADEAYTVDVTRKGIMVRGGNAAGVMYGTNLLLKSLPAGDLRAVTMPEVHITDAPRFRYRGAHLDEARHFFGADNVRTFIDMLALHNVNNFHWHLTDDQGWRLDIESLPRLAEVASRRPGTVIGLNTGRYDSIPVEGCYTRPELEAMVEYARQRHINIIPEIDMPGHMLAALAAYPELGCTGGPYEVWRIWGVSDDVLCAGNPKVYDFLDKVFDEVADIFPSPWIHIGGDECPKTRWRGCPRCRKAAEALPEGDTDPYERLQSRMTQHVADRLRLRGRRVIGWDELLDCGDIDSTAIIQSWRGAEASAEAARRGHDTFLSPCSHLYFNYSPVDNPDGGDALAHAGYIPLEQVFRFDPMPGGLTPGQQRHVIGVQPNLWSEYIKDFGRAQWLELPRLAAAAEVQWCHAGRDMDYDYFLDRLVQLTDTYRALGWDFCPAMFDVQSTAAPDGDGGLGLALWTIDDHNVLYTTDGSDPRQFGQPVGGTVSLSAPARLRAVVDRGDMKLHGLDRRYMPSRSYNCAVRLEGAADSVYYATSPSVLTDGLAGGDDFRGPGWLTVWTDPVTAVVDLGEEREVSSLAFNVNIATDRHRMDVQRVTVETSLDGLSYASAADEVMPELQAPEEGVRQHRVGFGPVRARTVRVTLAPMAQMPEWHSKPGSRAYLCVDELAID